MTRSLRSSPIKVPPPASSPAASKGASAKGKKVIQQPVKSSIPTPPRSSQGAPPSKRSSPRPVVSQPSPLGPVKKGGSSIMSPGTTSSGASKKAAMRKRGSMSGLEDADMLCPICDDICTCVDLGAGLGDSQPASTAWTSLTASPVNVIRKANGTGASKKATSTSKKTGKAQEPKKKAHPKLDQKVDRAAQYVISEYYFSLPASFYDEDHIEEYSEEYDSYSLAGSCHDSGYDSDSSLDALMFELSADEDDAAAEEMLISKVNSVIGPSAWLRKSSGESGESSSCEESDAMEEDQVFIFDPVDAANLVVNLPVPTCLSPSQQSCCFSGSEEDEAGPALTAYPSQPPISDLTPQILAAISAASKTLNAARQHYSQNPDLPFSREPAKHVQFLVTPQDETPVPIEEVIDTSRLHGSSPPNPNHPLTANLKRWERIPVGIFRKRRLSVPKAMPVNAFKCPPPNGISADLAVVQPPPESSLEMIGRRHTCAGLLDPVPKRPAPTERRLSLFSTTTTSNTRASATATDESDVSYEYCPPWFNGDDNYLLGEHWRSLSVDVELEESEPGVLLEDDLPPFPDTPVPRQW